MSDLSTAYKRCSTCKSPIDFGAQLYLCSVSTCNRPRLALFFCSLPCWEAHVPEARHRDAWAEHAKAPSHTEHAAALEPAPVPARSRIVQAEPQRVAVATAARTDQEDDVLVVISKLKRYI